MKIIVVISIVAFAFGCATAAATNNLISTISRGLVPRPITKLTNGPVSFNGDVTIQVLDNPKTCICKNTADVGKSTGGSETGVNTATGVNKVTGVNNTTDINKATGGNKATGNNKIIGVNNTTAINKATDDNKASGVNKAGANQSSKPGVIVEENNLKGYETVLNGTRIVKIHPELKEWNEARIICSDEGAHLAAASSINDHEYFVQALNENNLDFIWIGIHDYFKKGDFTTVWDSIAKDSSYMKWRLGRPDNSVNDPRCLQLGRKDGALNDVPCTGVKLPFICSATLVTYRNIDGIDGIIIN